MKEKSEKSGQKTRAKRKVSLWHRFLMSFEKLVEHFRDFFVSRLPNVREVRLWVVEWGLLVLVVFLLAIVQIFWYTDAFKTEAYVEGGSFAEATYGRVNSLNPLYVSSSSERALARLMFVNLVAPDNSGHLKGELAKSVKMSDDGLEWTLTMRDNIYWSDGEPITVDDALFTIDLIKNNDAKTTVGNGLSYVDVERVDDSTIKFKLPSIYLNFMEILEIPVVPKHILGDISPALIYESDFSLNPVVSGAFKLNAIQNSGSTTDSAQTIYLMRNDYYYKGKARLDNFVIKAYTSREDIIAAMNNAEVNATAALDSGDYRRLPRGINFRNAVTNGAAYAFMNTSTGIMKEVKVRKAVAQGVNVKEVIGENLLGRRIKYPILEEQASGLDMPSILKYDFDAAKNLLKDAGYQYNGDKLVDGEGKQIQVKLAVQKRDEITPVAEAFADQMRALGFDVNLAIFDESTSSGDFFTTVIARRDYDILFYEIDLGINIDMFTYYSSTQANESGWNFSNYNNALADDALLSARMTLDDDLRKAKYESFLKHWAEDVPSIGLYRSAMSYYYSDNVKIFSENIHMTDALDRFQGVEHWASKKDLVNLTP